MRFDIIKTYYFTKRAAIPYNQRCRTYNNSLQHHHLMKRSRISENPSRVFKSYSTKPSNSNMGLLAWYLGVLESRPILTKSISSAIIYGAADFTSQMITMEPYDAWNPMRTLRMAGFGMIILGPSQHFWFNFLGRLLPKRDMISTFKKLAMGQLVFGPMINGGFFSYNAALQGESGDEIFARLKRDLIPTLANGLLYWPLCDFLTYKIIPVHLQPLTNSSFSYLWTIYLTYMASLKKAGS